MTTIKNTFEQQLHQKFGVNVMSLEGVHSVILVDGTHGTDYVSYHDTSPDWVFGVHPNCKRLLTHTAGLANGATAKC